MKKWIVLLLVLLLLAGAAVGGYWWYQSTYITIGEMTLRRDVTQLDLSGVSAVELDKLPELTELAELDLRRTGLTAEEYERLRAAMPGCRIYWSVPFQSGYLDETVTEVTVTELTVRDLDILRYLPELRSVQALECRDYEALGLLMEQYPQLEVTYQVPVAGQLWRENTKEMILDCAAVQELGEYLPYLRQLETVTFTGIVADGEDVWRLMEMAPRTRFIWDTELFGLTVNSQERTLVLSQIPMESVDEVERALKYFPDLERVEMCDCGIPSAEMDALARRHPQIRFVWTVKVGRCTLRTDDTTFMPWKFGYTMYGGLQDKDCAELKYCQDIICMDLGHMWVSDYSFLENMPKMKYLVLAETRGKDFSALANLKELVFLELFLTEFDQLDLLTGLTKLEDLNICFSRVSDVSPLLEMTWLKRVWMVGVRATPEERQALREDMPDTMFSFYGKGSTEGAWRLSPNYKAMRDLLGMGYLYG